MGKLEYIYVYAPLHFWFNPALVADWWVIGYIGLRLPEKIKITIKYFQVNISKFSLYVQLPDSI